MSTINIHSFVQKNKTADDTSLPKKYSFHESVLQRFCRGPWRKIKSLFMSLSEILNIICRDASIFLLVKDTEIGNEE